MNIASTYLAIFFIFIIISSSCSSSSSSSGSTKDWWNDLEPMTSRLQMWAPSNLPRALGHILNNSYNIDSNVPLTHLKEP